ncbi:DUF5625 family protein [Candidatus Accumulibacter sp. ACC007]|uniref:DUF5625 family protein n=1 Tax=Candidatus Accumulibacter sp. ACC007 TaxID=2823333 RepID=UPI0025B7B811|nr:DUF5625 family protein [Candidatus Accumulibacter sp. ACC007]
MDRQGASRLSSIVDMTITLVGSVAKKWQTISMIGMVAFLSACVDESLLPTPPLTWPLDMQKSGDKIDAKFRVVDHREYSLGLEFGFMNDNQEDRERVRKLVGDDGQFINGDPGVPTPLRVKILEIRESGDKPFFEQELQISRLRSWTGNTFVKHIAYVRLNPGNYRVRVESLKDVAELAGMPLFFSIGFYPKSTAIK